jgi:hypothetical protein
VNVARWAAPAVLVCAALGVTDAARAQSAPQMQVHADQDTVGIGDVLHVQMTAQSGDAMPSDAQPGATPGFVVRGQSSSPSQTHIIANGVRTDRFALTVDWALQAQRVGTFAIGPATVVVGGTRYASRPINVRVVPAGQAPPRPAPTRQAPDPFGFSPFDPWKGLFPGFDRQEPQQPTQLPPVRDQALALAAPRARNFFLHATIDKTSAVVGEQVTFSVYQYIDAEAGGKLAVEPSGSHDPSIPDFVKRVLKRDDEDDTLEGFVSMGGHVWQVNLSRRWALFPLHAGDLEIGPQSLTLARPATVAGEQRTTETFRVHVTDPPLAGRPPGYASGDVGRFAVSAQVTPRDVDQGGAVGVHVEISGTGNLPAAITPPARDGLEWLAPESHEQLGPTPGNAFGGKRTFDFVVRVLRAGTIDLGEIALPFWDPTGRRYDVARAPLGSVQARPSATAASAAPADAPLSGMPPPRDVLEGTRGPRAHADDASIFWLGGVGAWPVAFGLAMAGRAVGRRVSQVWRVRRASPAADLKDRLAAARAACGGDDSRRADAAIARALEAATVAHAGVSVRGAVGDEVAERLRRAGVLPDAAAALAEILRECEVARFSPHASDIVAARDRWGRAQGAIRQLERGA